MSASAHGESGPKLTSDKPWILAATLIAAPLFFYQVSKGPGSTAHHHTGTKLDPHVHPAMPMTDDEGTKTDVASSVAAAEAEDTPKAASGPASSEEAEAPPKETEESQPPEPEQKEEPEK